MDRGGQDGPHVWDLPDGPDAGGQLRRAEETGRTRRRVAGKRGSGRRWATPDEWEVLIRDALPAYIRWQQWEKNPAKLRENSSKYGPGAPRGASLLAGRVVCGRCGNHMSISYAGKSNARYRLAIGLS